MDEATINRRRLAGLRDDFRVGPSFGAAILARTVQIGSTYPSQAGRVFGLVAVDVEVEPVEGAVPTLTPAGASEAFLALHVGPNPPPVGSYVLAFSVQGMLVFLYG